MLDDADANIVKVIVREVGGVPLGVRQGMAFIAKGLGVKKLPTVPGGVIDGVLVTRDKVIERGVK